MSTISTTMATRRCRCSRTSSTTASRRRCRPCSTISPTTSSPRRSRSPGSAAAPTTRSEWDEAFAEASDLDPDERIDELMDMPLLAGHLEAGLAAFDYSCDGVGQLD